MNKCGYKMCQSRLFASKVCISLSQLLLETLNYKKTQAYRRKISSLKSAKE